MTSPVRTYFFPMESPVQTVINEKNEHQVVLIAPLDWGLGHATRCIPIIRDQLAAGNKVILGGSGLSLILLKKEFPGLPSVALPGLLVRISPQPFHLLQYLKLIPAFLYSLRKEHQVLISLVKQYRIGLVISDNRYGLWNAETRCILITHQLRPRIPTPFQWTHPLIWYIIKKWCSHFNEIWIPDEIGANNLTGILNWGFTLQDKVVRHIGILSRFRGIEPQPPVELSVKPDILALLSGPEPQRSRFEKILLQRFRSLPYQCLIIQGLPGSDKIRKTFPNVTMIPHLPTPQLMYLLMNTRMIIARSGYSTIMDLLTIGRKAILVPTPGQTEQEYLGAHMKKIGYFTVIRQSEFKKIAVRLDDQEENPTGKEI